MQKTNLNSLPDDVLMQILKRIPAQSILDSTMFVCRRWWRLIRTRNFIFSHLHHSSSGLLITDVGSSECTFISITQDGQIEISMLSNNDINRYWSSCNGLALGPTFSYFHDFMIRNPVTRQNFTLPQFFSSVTAPPYSSSKTFVNLSAISFVANRMEYKVVRVYSARFPDPPSSSSWLKCAILTVGVDNAWRLVDTQHVSIEACKYFRDTPLVTEGFVHWVEDSRYNINTTIGIREQFVLTLNVETEIITQIPAPPGNHGFYHTYFSGGSYLSLLIGQDYLMWEVWEMKPETREWKKLPDIDLGAHEGLLNEWYDIHISHYKPVDGRWKLIPAGWLKYQEVIVFSVHRSSDWKTGFDKCRARLHIVYNVQTQSISFFKINLNANSYIPHKNTLIGLPG